MDNKVDINITELSKQKNNKYKSSQLVLQLSGKNVNSILVNTLRRGSLLLVPTYGFCRESILIEKNTSIFDNDYMRLRLSQLTIPNLKYDTFNLPNKYWKNINYGDLTREKDPRDKKKIELYINITNNSNELLNVTTDHIKIYEDGVELKDHFKHIAPILIVPLRPSQSFICRCVGVLGIGKVNDTWASCSNCFYEELDEHKYNLTLESQGQLEEYEILRRICKLLIEKIEDLSHIIKEKYSKNTDDNTLYIKLENEDHTLGNFINDILQDLDNVEFSGISKPDLLVDEVTIKLISTKNNPVDAVLVAFNKAKNILVKMLSLLPK